MGGHEGGELLRDFRRPGPAGLAVRCDTVRCPDPITDIVDLRDLCGTAECSCASPASPPSTPATNAPRSSEFPPPGSSGGFSWFERGRVVVVVEGEVADSRVEVEGAEADSLSPARSGC